MSDKKKRNLEPMIQRIEANQNGRLSSGQWRDMITEPLVPLLLLMLPAILFAGRFALAWRGLLIVFALSAVILMIPALFRARRYARVPVRFAVLYASEVTPFWMFWKGTTLHKENGDSIVFNKRLAPRISLEQDRAYLVYYFEDPQVRILLSIAPADHPDSDDWYPTVQFRQRQGKLQQ